MDRREEAKSILRHYIAQAVPNGEPEEFASVVDLILDAAAEQVARALANHVGRHPHGSGYGPDE